jgi:D-arginine dehydrogenase
MSEYDVAIIGAGIAGASLAATLPAEWRVVLLEAEDHPGVHSTGRSAAFWSETYGGPFIQPLTSASKAFLEAPPAAFSDIGFLSPRGALHLGTASDITSAGAMLSEFSESPVRLDRLNQADIDNHLTGRRSGWDVALWEPDCCDIDVGGLHGKYLAQARRNGGKLICRARARKLEWRMGHWLVETQVGSFEAKMLVNAAGAWADEIAGMAGVPAAGIQPFRRTIMQLAVNPPAVETLPLVVGLNGSFYFKPESGGKLWLSPHDEVASPPCDAAPEEIDIATAIARFEEVVDWQIIRLERKWAGLRSFAPDRLPVIGRDPANEKFFWLAGQGGFGIQTAPAVAELAAASISGSKIEISGVDPKAYTPDRFR